MSAPLSSPEPAGAHPSIDELADLAEGLVEPAEAAEALRRHLDGCAECRETVEALTEVQALLGDVETPPMPADVAARLDAALAAAAAEPAPRAPAEARTAPQEAPAAEPRAITPTPARTASSAPPAAPPGRSGAATGPGRPRRRRRLGLLAGAAAALGALAWGGVLWLVPGDTGRGASTTAAAPRPDVAAAQSPRSSGAAGTAYQDDRLTAQIQQLLTRSATAPGLRPAEPGRSTAEQPTDGGAEPPAQGSPAPAPHAATGSAATACPAPAAGTPLATDRGTYQGAPVDVLVYPVPGDAAHADVYLRSADCGPVLLHRTVPVR
ncbi:zf-HC2 domain-containing protein [Streptomyces sp. Y1]|uniref:Zf-HC2 domain-containing protein n=1 Tax=Streptomyces sp. Y1 TaxID=3238634 RepID=A0AB39TL29_9ACTN